MIPLGILAASGFAPVSAGSFDLLETEILASSAASVTFSGLSAYAADYQHLQIRAVVRGVRASFDRDLFVMEINGDTASNYSNHGLVGAGNAVYSFAGSSTSRIDLYSYAQASSSPAGAFSTYVIDFLDTYSTNKYKTIKSLSGGTVRSGESGVALSSGLWRNTNAVSSIKLYTASADIAQYSRFSLYGLKA